MAGNPWDLSNIILSNQAGANLARGIEGAGQGLAQGLRQYQQNKFMGAQATSRFEAAVSANPELMQFLQSPNAPKDVAAAAKKLASGGAVGFKDAAVLATFADSYNAEKQQQVQMQRNRFLMQQEQQNAAALRGAFTPGANTQQALRNYVNAGGVPDSATAQLMNASLDSEMVQQQRKAAPQPLLFQSEAELEKRYPKEQFDYNMTPQPNGSVAIMDGKINPRSPKQQVPEVPNPLTTEIYKDFAKERSDVVVPALKSLQAYDEISKILASKDAEVISGAFANAELTMKRVANALGAKYDDVQNTETMRALFAVPVAMVIKNFGAGTGLSDADREYAAKAAGGDITMNAETIKSLVRIGQQASRNIQKGYEERLDDTFPDDAEDPASKRIRKALKLPGAMKQPEVKLPAGWSIRN